MVGLAGMATPADGNVTTVAESEVFDITNFAAIYYETSCEQACLSLKRTPPSRDFLKASKDTESFEINC